jgi:hypothetical protein
MMIPPQEATKAEENLFLKAKNFRGYSTIRRLYSRLHRVESTNCIMVNCIVLLNPEPTASKP